MMAMKSLHLLRVFQGQGMLVQLLFTCIVDITPFLSLFTYFVFIIYLMYILTGANLGSEEDYPLMNQYLAMWTQVFRNSLGDIAMPVYQKWCDAK